MRKMFVALIALSLILMVFNVLGEPANRSPELVTLGVCGTVIAPVGASASQDTSAAAINRTAALLTAHMLAENSRRSASYTGSDFHTAVDGDFSRITRVLRC